MDARDNIGMGSVTLDQLLALTDEIAALVRAGIPLERGLTAWGQDASGKLGLLASRLADRMRAGESLQEILEKDTGTFPPVWRSVVLAGIRTGHLAAALESLAVTGRGAAELRRSIAVAFIYPTIVVAMAYSLFIFTMVYIVPGVLDAYVTLTDAAPLALSAVASLAGTIYIWGPLVPLAAVLMFSWWWYRSGRAIRALRGGREVARRRFLFGRDRRFPSVRQSLRDGRMATFAELLRLMDRHEVPMPEAMVLAADASGDGGLSRAARTIAQRLEGGAVFRSRDELPQAFPPLLGWSIVSGMGRTALDRTLATSAEMYRQRALHAARWASVYLPIVLTVAVGGSAVFAQAMIVFLPLISLLYRLAAPL